VSAKLTPEICINNVSSNSRPTAVGRQATAANTILRTVSRLFFFFFSLPLKRTTELHLQVEKHTETLLHLNLGHLVGFFFCVCVVLFYFMHPLWWDNYRTTSEAWSPGLETETVPKLLRLKPHAFELGGFFLFCFVFLLIFYFPFYFNSFLYIHISFIYLFFYFYSYLYFFIFDFQFSLSL
jgi:hypothetical protein